MSAWIGEDHCSTNSEQRLHLLEVQVGLHNICLEKYYSTHQLRLEEGYTQATISFVQFANTPSNNF